MYIDAFITFYGCLDINAKGIGKERSTWRMVRSEIWSSEYFVNTVLCYKEMR